MWRQTPVCTESLGLTAEFFGISVFQIWGRVTISTAHERLKGTMTNIIRSEPTIGVYVVTAEKS